MGPGLYLFRKYVSTYVLGSTHPYFRLVRRPTPTRMLSQTKFCGAGEGHVAPHQGHGLKRKKYTTRSWVNRWNYFLKFVVSPLFFVLFPRQPLSLSPPFKVNFWPSGNISYCPSEKLYPRGSGPNPFYCRPWPKQDISGQRWKNRTAMFRGFSHTIMQKASIATMILSPVTDNIVQHRLLLRPRP